MNQQTDDKETAEIAHTVSQSELIEPLEAAKEPDYESVFERTHEGIPR